MPAIPSRQFKQFGLSGRRRRARPTLSSVCGMLGVTLSVLVGGALGCSGDTPTGPPPLDAAHAYWTLQFPYHTVNLALTAPYNTARLAAIPRNALGEPLANLGPVRYTTSDSNVTIDSTGLITAHGVTASTQVTATLQDPQQHVTYSDVVTIQVTATAPPLPFRTFSMQPLPGDSAKRTLDGNNNFAWPVHATDGGGTTLCDSTGCSLLVSYTSSNPAVATINSRSGGVGRVDTGQVVFTATTLAYGQVLRDSVVFRVGYPINMKVTLFMTLVAGVAVVTGFSSKKVMVVGVGAVVLWTSCNQTGPINKNFDVLFDQPAAVDSASCQFNGTIISPPTGSGNIAPFGGDTTSLGPFYNRSLNNVRCRRFSVPGVYHWHSSLFPADTFTLIVK